MQTISSNEYGGSLLTVLLRHLTTFGDKSKWQKYIWLTDKTLNLRYRCILNLIRQMFCPFGFTWQRLWTNQSKSWVVFESLNNINVKQIHQVNYLKSPIRAPRTSYFICKSRIFPLSKISSPSKIWKPSYCSDDLSLNILPKQWMLFSSSSTA